LRSRVFPFLILCIILFSPNRASACLWDRDTLAMERRRFPDALELITGKFLRHSTAYYRWRVDDRLARIADHPTSPALYDDLAVAHDKLGDHDKAIETILKVETFAPGRYETYANLGTFQIHAGRLAEGVEWIDKAIEINPDAHFGREIYQKHLVNYVLSRRVDGKTVLPLGLALIEPPTQDGYPWDVRYHAIRGFSQYIIDQYVTDRSENSGWYDRELEEVRRAVKGVLGMMRFGNHRSSVLLEALGNLLSHDRTETMDVDAKQLAARAYLKASYEVQDAVAKRKYRMLAGAALDSQVIEGTSSTIMELNDLEAQFKVELADADQWYASIEAQEAAWLNQKLNLDAEFDRIHFSDPQINDRAQ
jgi:tetratricopeptide (TPR) repeat protein